MRGDALGDEVQRLAPGAEDVAGEVVGRPSRAIDTPPVLDGEVEEHRLGELVAEAERLDPVEQRLEVALRDRGGKPVVA